MFDDGNGNIYVVYAQSDTRYIPYTKVIASVQQMPNWNEPVMNWHDLSVESGDPRLVFTGSWITPAALPNGGGYISGSNVTYDYVTFTFFGGGIRYYGRIYEGYGIAGITLDDGSEETVDCYDNVTLAYLGDLILLYEKKV